MTKLVPLFIFLFISYSLSAQTFVKNIGNPGVNDGVTCLQEYQNKLFITGYSGKQNYIASYDLNGMQLWKKYFSFSEHRNFITDFVMNGNALYITGYGHNSGTDVFEEFFVKFDLSNMKIAWARKTSINIRPNNIHLYNGSLYLTGDEHANGKSGLCFLKLNAKNGKLEDFTTWYYMGNESAAVSFIDKDVLYTGGRYGLRSKTDKYRAAISQFDIHDFDQIRSNYFLNSKQDFARAYLADFIIKDDTIISACFSNNQGIDNNYSISVINSLKDGSVNWTYEYKIEGYNSITVRDIVELQDAYLLFGYTKAPKKNLFLVKVDKQGYPIEAHTFGGKYSDKVFIDQGKFILEKNGDIYLAAQSKNINEIGDYDSFILKMNLEKGFQDSCIISEKVKIEMFAYDEFIEGDVYLLEYDTLFKETNIAYEYVNPKTEIDNYLCQEKIQETDEENAFSFQNIAFNNTVFLMDASLSMNREDRMPILKKSLYKILNFMREEDKISIISFANEAQLILNGISASNALEIEGKIDSLASSGQSDIIAGIELGIKIASENFNTNSNNRIIITTDGDLSFEKQKEIKNALLKNKNENLVFTIFLFNSSTTYYKQLKTLTEEIGANVQVVNPDNIDLVLLNELRAKKQ